MQAWAAFAIAQLVLVAISLRRLSKLDDTRTIRWPGVAVVVVAALALLVLVRAGSYVAAIAIFGSVVLASDALLLGSALVLSLCTRPVPPPIEAPTRSFSENIVEDEPQTEEKDAS